MNVLRFSKLSAVGYTAVALLGCTEISSNLPQVPTFKAANAPQTAALSVSQKLITERETSHSIKASGFSAISVQPSKSINQRRLMAMRAAKLDAYRVLTEQIHGIRIKGETTIAEAVVTSDRLATAVSGLIIGAEVNSIKATSNDTYQVDLSISEVHLQRLISKYRRGI